MRVLKPGTVSYLRRRESKLATWASWKDMDVNSCSVDGSICNQEKNHPWKGLAKTYSHYGTNGYYRNLMKEVGFENVQGRLPDAIWYGAQIQRF